MVKRVHEAAPNAALLEARDRLGQSQADVANALNRLAIPLNRRTEPAVDPNQISRWERGITRPSPFYRQLLAQYYGLTIEELGLLPARAVAPVARQATPRRRFEHPDVLVAESQQQWRATREHLNAHRLQLAHAIADLHGPDQRLGDTPLLTTPGWVPDQPVPLEHVTITHEPDDGVFTRQPGARAAHVLPLAAPGRRFHRYSHAIRDLDKPTLFENRTCWSLRHVTGSSMMFGETTYFDQVDFGEALAHEAALARAPSRRNLPLRTETGDPFDLAARPMAVAVDTLTIRQDADGASFVMHRRDPGNVAVAGGMMHVMPCGVFQPSSIHAASAMADFDLWRNIMREYSEEFLGNPEHDGTGSPLDYGAEPFATLETARAQGRLRVFYLGLAMDALTLFGEILTVVVYDADVYDKVFAGLVDHNEEGSVVKTGRVHPTSMLPFTAHNLAELLDGGQLAPAAAGCLSLAWQHRRVILDGAR